MSLTASASLEFDAPKLKSSNIKVSASQTLGSPSFSPSLSDMPSINNLFNPLDVSSVKLVKLKKGLKTKFSETALFNLSGQ